MADAPTRVVITGGSTEQSVALGEPATPQQSFVQRFINLTIKLDPNQGVGQPTSFTASGTDTVTLSGFRINLHAEWVGGRSSSRASLKVYGMTGDQMNQLSVLGMVFNSVQQNSITISAGTSNDAMTPVFGGTIWSAMADYNKAPNVPFEMECTAGYAAGMVPVIPSSFAQQTDVATIMSGFARQLGLAFENNGVSKQIPPCYFSGSLNAQIEKCKKMAGINAVIVDAGSKLSIWPIGGSRTSLNGGGNSVPLISKATGMKGYPRLSPNGYMIVQCLYNPQVAQGGQVQVQSDVVPQANRTCVVQKVDLDLDSLVPKGQWLMTLYCYPLGFAAPAPPAGR